MRMTLTELLRLLPDLVVRKIRLFLLDRKLDKHYMDRDYYTELGKEARRGLQYTDSIIVNLEAQKRRL